ncbi:hypothetical protein [Pseudoprevotella muciniphila]|uniref:hypothetical protein n=1 Tax=Pseudoprevotella muciniphila TaxID=2133944 RepID=UPI001868CAF4|nr:hypothetical protein [Pseudoprevotella muciniphila]
MPLLSVVFATLGVNGVNEVTDDTTKWKVNDHLSNKTYVANFANFINFKQIAFLNL